MRDVPLPMSQNLGSQSREKNQVTDILLFVILLEISRQKGFISAIH